MHDPIPDRWPERLLVVAATALLLTACSSPALSSPGVSGAAAPHPTGSASPSEASPGPTAPVTIQPSQEPSPAPDTAGGTTYGDVPDDAVFLEYQGTAPAYTIQYVEGWQVSQQPDGVVIRDKDSSEVVVIVPTTSDVKGYVASTDLPALQGQVGFELVRQDTVKVNGRNEVHLVYHLPASPDPVTGKRVPSTIDRYYIAGPTGLAIVTLSTPDGVDNVDAFRQMIDSFKWR
jgi:hypothetical protein